MVTWVSFLTKAMHCCASTNRIFGPPSHGSLLRLSAEQAERAST